MLALIIFLICVFVTLAAAAWAAWSDIRTMTIPNMHSALIIGAFVVCYAFLWLLGRDDVMSPLLSHLISGISVFLLTLLLFGLRIMGAGDSKLASALALWVALKGLPAFLFYTAMVGALLGIAALLMRKWKPFKDPQPGSWVASAQAGESKVPYGVAIAAGALASFMKLGYFSAEVLGSFVLS